MGDRPIKKFAENKKPNRLENGPYVTIPPERQGVFVLLQKRFVFTSWREHQPRSHASYADIRSELER